MNNFKSELKNLIPAYLDELNAVDVSEFEDYQFSESYKKKMSDLLRRRKRFYYPLIKTQMRKVACIAAAVVIAAFCSLGFKAVRKAVYNFFIKHNTDHAIIEVKDEESDESSGYSVLDSVEEVYDVTDIPQDYELVESSESVAGVHKLWVKKGGLERIKFEQFAGNEQVAWDNEQHNIYKSTVDGQEYIIAESKYGVLDSSTIIMWNNGRYTFSLFADYLDVETVIKMSKSVKDTGRKIESDF